MNRELTRIFWLEGLYLAISIYISIFVNLYFWQNDKTLESLLLFNTLYLCFSFIGNTIGSLFVIKDKPKYSYYLSAFSALMLFLCLYLSDYFTFFSLLLVVSLFSGLVVGSFYSTTNNFVSNLSNEDELKTYGIRIGFLMNVLSIILPLLNAFIIYHVSYYASFVLMFFVSCIYLYFATRTPNIEIGLKKINLRDLMKEKYSNKLTLFIIITIMAYQFSSIMQTILLFTLSKNEVYVSYLNIMNVVIALVGLFLLTKLKKEKIEKQLIIITTLVMTTLFILMLSHTKEMYFVSMVLLVLTILFYRYITVTIPFLYIGNMNKVSKVVLIWKREWWLTVGRFVILALMYLTVKGIESPMLPFITVGVVILSLVSVFIFLKNEPKNPI